MIILEGPNIQQRQAIFKALEELLRPRLGDLLQLNVSDTPSFVTTSQVVRMLNVPNLSEVRDGLALDFAEHHAIYHMAGYALAATGSLLVLAHNRAPYPRSATHISELGKYLPTLHVYAEDSASVHAQQIVNQWERFVRQAAERYKYGGTGPLETDNIMVVGERINPFRPRVVSALEYEDSPLAFTSNQGCSFFLHSALQAAGGSYYLTNAVKTLTKKLNKAILQEELELVKPSRIVAMGTEAAHALAELKVSFTSTYHPQYWKRFKNKDVGELVELLRPH